MRFPSRARSGADESGSAATVRVHRAFRALLDRLQPGEIAVIDRRDLDAASAKLLADRKPFAVLNATEFVSGRFANLGPSTLADAGVVLLEGEAAQVRALKDGTLVRLEGNAL